MGANEIVEVVMNDAARVRERAGKERHEGISVKGANKRSGESSSLYLG